MRCDAAFGQRSGQWLSPQYSFSSSFTDDHGPEVQRTGDPPGVRNIRSQSNHQVRASFDLKKLFGAAPSSTRSTGASRDRGRVEEESGRSRGSRSIRGEEPVPGEESLPDEDPSRGDAAASEGDQRASGEPPGVTDPPDGDETRAQDETGGSTADGARNAWAKDALNEWPGFGVQIRATRGEMLMSSRFEK